MLSLVMMSLPCMVGCRTSSAWFGHRIVCVGNFTTVGATCVTINDYCIVRIMDLRPSMPWAHGEVPVGVVRQIVESLGHSVDKLDLVC